MSRFKNKVAIVTGGGSGIGQAVTKGLVAEGAKVIIVGRRETELAQTAKQHPDSIQYLSADVAKNGSSQNIVDFALKTYGRLDIVINNAGFAAVKPLSEITDEEIEQTVNVNLKGLIALSRDAFNELSKNNGVIINLSSVAAQSAVPGFSVYGATKSGADRVTKILANEFGPHGVRVNAVAPGLTDTDMLQETPSDVIDMLVNTQTALRRLGQTQDVTESILWLASDQAQWVTGQVIQASGGLMLN